VPTCTTIAIIGKNAISAKAVMNDLLGRAAMPSIADWLQKLGMPAYAADFQRHGVDPTDDAGVLRHMTSVELQELGIPPAARLKMLAAIAELAPVEESQRRSEARHDFVRRFVAVAISIGFAGVLVKMTWLSAPSWPNVTEQEQLWRLFTAFLVILLGWEWHHKDLGIHKTTSIIRFLVDVAVVIVSLIFLISYANERIWLISLVVIFALYVVWDVVNLIEDRTLLARHNALRGPLTNAVWLAYFGGILWLVVWQSPTYWHTVLVCIAIIAGAGFLTWQGNKPDSWNWSKRLGVVFILFLLLFVLSLFIGQKGDPEPTNPPGTRGNAALTNPSNPRGYPSYRARDRSDWPRIFRDW
jgi:hypothetical protein